MPKQAALSWHKAPRGVALESPAWQLIYDLPLGLFDLAAPAFPHFHIRWARARAHYRRGKAFQTAGTDDGQPRQWKVEPVQDSHGPGLRLFVQVSNSRRPTLEFSATVYQDAPFLVLELAVLNTLSVPLKVQDLNPLEIDPEWGGKFSLGAPLAGLYCTGWQSWSPAGWKPTTGRDVRTALGPLFAPMHDSPVLRPLQSGHFSSDLVGVLTPSGDGPALLVGQLSTADQFGYLEVQLEKSRASIGFACAASGVPLAPQERLASERVALCLAPPGQSPLEAYGEALGQEMAARVQDMPPRGWCSWPAFGPKVGEKDILRQIVCLEGSRDRLPLQILQVDDGWERAVGDWEANERFPHGMRWLAERIREAGFTPGIWLAPVISQPRSRIAREHPEWILRDERGRPVSAGFSSVGFSQGLDVTHPEVEGYLQQLIAAVVHEWGYSYLKLDFLYGAALPGRRYRPGVTRAQALRRALEIIRTAAGPETILLGCGCPLGPAIGLVDTMRVEQDVTPDWKPRLGVATPLLRGDPSFPATVNTVRNILTRAWMHRRLWVNDPDPLILRRSGSRLTPAEVHTLVTAVALSGGTWMLGDDLPGLEAEVRPPMAVALPAHRLRVAIPDLLTREYPQQVVLEANGPWGHGWNVALINWEDRSADLSLELGTLGLSAETSCHVHEFWNSEYRRIQGAVPFSQVEAHGCRVFMLRVVEQVPQWVGSSLHLVQGTEVQDWQSGPEGIALTLGAGRALEGSVLLWLPGIPHPQMAAPENVAAHLEEVGGGLWRIQLQTGPEPVRIVVGQP
jgi:alpha-galactosidase